MVILCEFLQILEIKTENAIYICRSGASVERELELTLHVDNYIRINENSNEVSLT